MSTTSLAAYFDGGSEDYKTSVWNMIEEGCQIAGDNPAVISMHQPAYLLSNLVPAEAKPDQDCLQWTFPELRQGCCRLVSALIKRNIKPGMTLATFIPNGAECPLLYWAAAMLRLTFAPLDYGSLSSARHEELRAYLSTLRPSVVVVKTGYEVGKLESICSELQFDVAVKLTLEDPTSMWHALDTVASSLTSSDIITQSPIGGPDDPNRPSIILFTSGTSTGKPKGVPQTVLNLCAGQTTYPHARHIDHTSRFILHTANFRAACATYIFTCASQGAALIMPGESFTTTSVFAAITKQKATNLWAVPAQAFALTEDLDFEKQDFSSLKTLVMSGDMITRPILERAKRAFSTTDVICGHGMTEGVGCLGWTDSKANIPSFGDIAAVGTVLAGTRLKLVENGKVCKIGETGEMHLGGAKLVSRYLDGVQSEVFYEDENGNWLITGDRAMVDDKGHVFVLGRSKDIIKRKGVPIPPAVIESCLATHVGLAQCIDIPDQTLGSSPVVVLKSLGKNSEDDLKRIVIDTLGPDYAIGHALTLEQLGFSDWPVNETGKIMKVKLKEAALKYLNIQ